MEVFVSHGGVAGMCSFPFHQLIEEASVGSDDILFVINNKQKRRRKGSWKEGEESARRGNIKKRWILLFEYTSS